MPYPQKTAAEANEYLVQYENLNKDLPPTTRRQLGIFVIAPKVGLDAVEELIGQPVYQTLFRHRCWMWWNAMNTSGLGGHWDEIAKLRNEDGYSTQDWLTRLKRRSNEDQWVQFSDRMGVRIFRDDRKVLNVQRYSRRRGPFDNYWTKGGAWFRDRNMTKIIVFGENLPPRPLRDKIHERIGNDMVKQVEAEVHNVISPDKEIVPAAKFHAVRYVRRRLAEILHVDRSEVSHEIASWFFDQPVEQEDAPYKKDWRDPRRGYKHIHHGKVRTWRWI